MHYSGIRIDASPPLGFRLWCRVRRHVLGRLWYRRKWRSSGAIPLISYPKAGRTWVRLMLGKVIADVYGLDVPFESMMALDHLHDFHPDTPLVFPRHDDYPQLKTIDELVQRKDEYRDSRVILLVRDLRDLAVSSYFQMSKRRGKFDGSLHEFLHNERGGFETMLRFHNIWAAERHQSQAFLLLRYEDLHQDTVRELRRVTDFVGLKDIDDDVLRHAVDFASFDNMRKRELTDRSSSQNRLGGDRRDPESLKTRKGKIGGFRDYMSEEDAQWMTERMRHDLDPFYGYPYEDGVQTLEPVETRGGHPDDDRSDRRQREHRQTDLQGACASRT